MFQNECIVITGGSSGIGKVLAGRCLAGGARVALLARDTAKLAAAAAELSAHTEGCRQRVLTCACDVREAAAVERALADVADGLGSPSWLINSAGVLKEGTAEELSVDDFRRIMDINFFGTLHCTKAVLPYMRRAGRGRIVNIGSMAGLLGVYGYSAYCASKHAVTGFSAALRMELAPENIHVHLVCPPEFDSPMVEELNRHRSAENRAVVQSIAPMGVEEVADAVLAGLRRGDYEIVTGTAARLLRLADRLFPWLGRRIGDRHVARVRASRHGG